MSDTNHTSPDWTDKHQENSEPDFYGKWISVEDELPDMGFPVLMWGCDENPITGYRTNTESGARWYEYGSDEWMVGVTHWMPLPEPPKS